jgi:hypothetical protein
VKPKLLVACGIDLTEAARLLRLDRNRIGPWDEELTAQSRGQIAVSPDYVEKCIAAWVMQPEQPVRTRPDMTRWESKKGEPAKVQERFFPE